MVGKECWVWILVYEIDYNKYIRSLLRFEGIVLLKKR